MIEWHDEGILLAIRPHGETAAIVDAFTARHGRHAGIVAGGASRRMRPFLQPAVLASLCWRARLEDQLGRFAVEPLHNRAAAAMGEPLALAALAAITALLVATLPEREPHPRLWQHTNALLDLPSEAALWPLGYLRWEMALLDELGFGLDLSACAVTGAREGLAYVSPRTGRAVSAAGAGAWGPRLLPLPPVLRGEAGAGTAAIAEALAVTGHFLRARLMPEGRALPPARDRLLGAIARAG
jgi:DNA repair protein RecO (recombination protein O)